MYTDKDCLNFRLDFIVIYEIILVLTALQTRISRRLFLEHVGFQWLWATSRSDNTCTTFFSLTSLNYNLSWVYEYSFNALHTTISFCRIINNFSPKKLHMSMSFFILQQLLYPFISKLRHLLAKIFHIFAIYHFIIIDIAVYISWKFTWEIFNNYENTKNQTKT